MNEPNPYAPPVTTVGRAPSILSGELPLASRGERFGGALIDTMVSVVGSVVPVVWLARGGAEFVPPGIIVDGRFHFLALALLCSLPVVGLQAVLLARRGQSIGKLAMHTRIVRSNGRRAGFVHTVLLRWAPLWLLTETPALLELLRIQLGIEPALAFLALAVEFVDAIQIFGPRRRCLHDYLADTCVVAASGDEPRAVLRAD